MYWAFYGLQVFKNSFSTVSVKVSAPIIIKGKNLFTNKLVKGPSNLILNLISFLYAPWGT